MACYIIERFVILSIIYLPLIATQERERLAGEIVPVGAEQSGDAWAKHEQHGASNAIDLDQDTNAIPVLRAGGGSNPWLKVFLNQVHCIQQVLFYTGRSQGTWTCSGRKCECSEGTYTFCLLYGATVSIATEQAHVSSVRPECIHGDIITIDVRSSAWVLPVHEIAVIGIRKEDQNLPTITPPPTTATTDVPIVGSTESSETKPQSTTSAVLDQGSTESLAALTFSCWAGSYMADSGCQQCPQDMVSPSGSTSEGDCVYGPCSAGSYMTNNGCQQCEENTFSADGASSCTNCSDHMVSANGSKSEDDCFFAPCLAGNYMTDSGCLQCGENTFSADGASSCTSCSEGMISAAGSTSDGDCFFGPCLAGNYMTDSGCQQCGENTFSAAGASSCTNCLEHMISAAGSTSEDNCIFAPCFAGSYMTDNGCQQCEENTFSAAGAFSCTGCSEDMVSPAGSTSEDDCFFVPCFAGSHMTDSGCQQCGKNTFSTNNASSCTSCPEDMVSTAGSKSEQDCFFAPCSAGSYMTNNGCQQCGKNTFSADGASSCTNCSEGMVSAAGSTSDEDCFFEECPAGQYRSSNMTTCANCRVNAVSEVGATECTTCPAGSEANANLTSCSCSLGWYSTKGDQPPCRRCEALDSCQSKTSQYMDILIGAFKSGDIQGVINGFNVIVNSAVTLSPENAQQLIQLLSSMKHLLKNASILIEGLSTVIMELIEIVKNSKPEFSNEKKNSEIIEIIEAVSMTLKEGSNITTASILAKSIVLRGEGVRLDAPKAVPTEDLPIRINFGTQEGQRANVAVMGESFKDLLPKPPGINDTIGSPIVSVNFMNTHKVPKSSFSLTFQLKQYPEHEGYTMESRCVYLNTTTDEWLTNGCKTIINKDETCTCNCSHTTSFAILMSPTKITDTDTQTLVSYIMGFINIAFLLLTFCLVAPFKKLRNKQLVAIQLSLVLTLILGHVSFASLSAFARITVDELEDPLLALNTECVAGVTLTQYFFLSAFFWMGCIAWTFFKKIANAIKSFGNTDRYYFHKCAVISWVCPAVFPVAALLLSMFQNKDGYTMPYVGASKENGTNCWVENPWRYIGFLAPGYLILLFNCVCFGMVARVIIKSARLGKGNTNLIKAARAMMVVAVSVGLPWIVIGIAVGPVAFRTFVQYLFIVLSGMQGPLLFIAMIIFQDDATASIRTSINKKKKLFAEMKQSTSAYITNPNTTSQTVSFKRGASKLRAIDEDLEQ